MLPVFRPVLTNRAVTLLDTFTDANNTLATAHTAETGQTYSVSAFGPGINGARWIVISNVLVFQSTTNTDASAIATVEANASDLRLTATMAIQNPNPANCQIGIVFRYVNTSNFWWLRYVENTLTYDLLKVVSGVETKYGSYSYTATTGFEAHAIQIDAVGSSVAVRIDGTQRLTATSSDLSSATKVGYYGYINSTSADAGYIDTVQVIKR